MELMEGKRIIIIIGGGIEEYKKKDIIRRMSERGENVRKLMKDEEKKLVKKMKIGEV